MRGGGGGPGGGAATKEEMGIPWCGLPGGMVPPGTMERKGGAKF